MLKIDENYPETVVEKRNPGLTTKLAGSALVLGLALTGCGSNNGEGQPEDPETTIAQATATPDDTASEAPEVDDSVIIKNTHFNIYPDSPFDAGNTQFDHWMDTPEDLNLCKLTVGNGEFFDRFSDVIDDIGKKGLAGRMGCGNSAYNGIVYRYYTADLLTYGEDSFASTDGTFQVSLEPVQNPQPLSDNDSSKLDLEAYHRMTNPKHDVVDDTWVLYEDESRQAIVNCDIADSPVKDYLQTYETSDEYDNVRVGFNLIEHMNLGGNAIDTTTNYNNRVQTIFPWNKLQHTTAARMLIGVCERISGVPNGPAS